MRQTPLRLTEIDRLAVQEVRSKGMHHAREVNRAHILSCLDRGVPESHILAVLGVSRTALWRTRTAYLQGGLQLALFDLARPGRPPKYGTDVEARIVALACSPPPPGRRRWTIMELERVVQREPGLEGLSRETVRRILKKALSNPGGA